MDPITSVKNTRIKEWASLKQKKFRDSTGLFLIEGVRSVEEALRSGAQIEVVLIDVDQRGRGKLDEIENLVFSRGLELLEVTSNVLEHIADTQTPQATLAVARRNDHDWRRVIEGKESPMYILLDQLRDPGNLGTIIRTADAIGATAVFVGQNSADVYNPKTVRSTMGSLFHIPVIPADLVELATELKRVGVKITALTTDEEEDIYNVTFDQATAIVIGSESEGLSEQVLELVDQVARIPMPGQAESLNAAIAASVALYEAYRQRNR